MQRKLWISGALALAALPAASLAGTTLLDENFNELTPMLTATSVGEFSAIGGTNVDIVGGALFGSLCVAPESGNCIDLNGSNGNPQGILRSNSAFSLVPGVNYYLSFDLIGSQRGITTSATVTFGSYDQLFTLVSGDVTSGVVSDQLITVSAPTTAYLTFASNTPGNVGTLLDNVVLSQRGLRLPCLSRPRSGCSDLDLPAWARRAAQAPLHAHAPQAPRAAAARAWRRSSRLRASHCSGAGRSTRNVTSPRGEERDRHTVAIQQAVAAQRGQARPGVRMPTRLRGSAPDSDT